MQRRKFIQGVPIAIGTGAITIAGGAAAQAATPPSVERAELIEWRTYEMAWGGNEALMMSYLKDALRPALLRLGVTQFATFKEYGEPNPVIIHVMISYPNAVTYVECQELTLDEEYVYDAEAYDRVATDTPIYSRFSSSLLRAFSGMPRSVAPDRYSELLELRTYEAPTDDALRRKIRMFNEYELDIFAETGLKPVFFGDMIAGPYRPALTYLLQFEDMQQRDDSWENFSNNVVWNRIKGAPEFAGGVSNIRRTFLVPA